MTNETDSFVNEVDESLREERLLTLFKRFGPWLLGAFVAVLLGIGGWQYWRQNQIEQARAHSDEYVAAQELMRSGDLDGAKTAFETLATEGPQIYRVMARMEHAAILSEQGDLEGALADFDLAARESRDPTVRETAQLRAAYIAAETQDFAALQTRLQPLIDSESRLSFLARELLAIEAWEAGQNDLARTTLESLSLAFDAPEAVRNRASIALQVIGPPAETAPTPAEQQTPSEGDNE